MDIGKTKRVIEVLPAEEPMTTPEPDTAPAEAPEREEEKVDQPA
jgi:hypothetical protein